MITYSTLNFFLGTIIIAISLCIYILGKQFRSVRIFSCLGFFVSLWTFSVAIYIAVLPQEIVSIIFKCSYFLGTIISSLFLLFSYSHPSNQKIPPWLLFLISIVEIVLAYLIMFTDTIITQAFVSETNAHQFLWGYGPFWFIFDLYFFSCWILGIIILYNKYRRSKEVLEKRGLGIIVLAFLVGVIPPVIFGIIFPRIGIYNYDWLSTFSGIFWVIIVSYAIVKHHLFSIKVIAIELVTFGLWVVILGRLLVSTTTTEMLLAGSILVVTIIFGIMIIRSTLHEIEQREHINKLTIDLQKAYKTLDTKDVPERI